MRRTVAVLAGTIGALTLAGCGAAATAGTDRPDRDGGTGLVTTTTPALVSDGGDGAELCVGPITMSVPAGCSGPRLVGWDWADHDGDFAEVGGVRQGLFVVVGTYDGSSLTVREVTPQDEWDGEYPDHSRDFSTPCPEPAGGWQVQDPALTTEETLQQVGWVARGLEGYAGSWTDVSTNPAFERQDLGEEEHARLLNDPTQLVFNVAVTGAPAVAEERLREVWGGALCVSTAERTEAELRDIEDAVSDMPGYLDSSVLSPENVLDLHVVHDDGTLQDELDAEYGPGVVRVSADLTAVG
ncbi:hypothetical protein [Georgenia alba]|uniref:Uncharacterized protein n=1 Tax=Georgenia alba TaxID=2233858 RepID=A0ABW2Q2G5_9MICO